ncbi:leucine-rich repeat-containing protein 74A-like [Lineus longissimus]|uniref:leucine-rich repeat-containing protein 74A-like n=1 Tax=Lineus longissimus TaxID=88925 RepID=UPI00315D373D
MFAGTMTTLKVLPHRRSIPRLYVRTPVQRRHDVIIPRIGHRSSKIVRFDDIDDAMSDCSRVSVSSSFTDHAFDPDDDYDFDADDDLLASMNEPNKTLPICEHLYLAACRKYRIIPVQKFYQQLSCSRICLSNTPLGEVGARAIAVAFVRNHDVVTLELSGDDIGPVGAQHLAEVLLENVSIASLDLSDNKFGTEGAIAMAGLLKKNRNLTKVKLAGNNFCEDDAVHFSDALIENNTLEELDLSYNNLSTRGGMVLKNALGENCTLQVLNLRWNHLRKHGALGIADGLKFNVGLRKLDISWNGFGVEGCHYLSQALKVNRTLKELDVSANRIGMLAVKLLLKGLTKSDSLETLKIGTNPLTTDAAIYVLQALDKAEESILTTLDLTNIQVDGVFLHILGKIKEKRTFSVTHGMVMRQDEIKKVSKDDVFDEDDPLSVLFEFMRQKNLRLKDLFGVFDKNGSDSITKAEFRNGFKKFNIPLSRRSLEQLMTQLDKDGDGSVDFCELSEGQRENNRKRLMQRMKRKKRGSKQKDPQEALRLKVQFYLASKDRKDKEEKKRLAEVKAKEKLEREAQASLTKSLDTETLQIAKVYRDIPSEGIAGTAASIAWVEPESTMGNLKVKSEEQLAALLCNNKRFENCLPSTISDNQTAKPIDEQVIVTQEMPKLLDVPDTVGHKKHVTFKLTDSSTFPNKSGHLKTKKKKKRVL